MTRVAFVSRLLDLLFPRGCVVCGRRLAVMEQALCMDCNRHLPRTRFHTDFYENEMARRFWRKLPVERAYALFFYHDHSRSARILYAFKYGDRPDVARAMGSLLAREVSPYGFFEGIDFIVPVPLARKRERSRGYNQSEELARGIAAVTSLSVETGIVRRARFERSQTRLTFVERQANVEHAFSLRDGSRVAGCHVLLVDDVVTSGSTLVSCGKELMRAGVARISIISVAFTK